jgi:hypothetical protein
MRDDADNLMKLDGVFKIQWRRSNCPSRQVHTDCLSHTQVVSLADFHAVIQCMGAAPSMPGNAVRAMSISSLWSPSNFASCTTSRVCVYSERLRNASTSADNQASSVSSRETSSMMNSDLVGEYTECWDCTWFVRSCAAFVR